MIMYKIKCLENRVKVFKDGVEYIEMDVVTTCKNFIQDHEEFFNILPQMDADTLEKILSPFNADYNGVKYRKDKVGDLIKEKEGQLALW